MYEVREIRIHKHDKSLKQGFIDFLAGGIGGLCNILSAQPFE